MELMNPGLDNDLGSSWRSSQQGFNGLPETFIPQASIWRYRKGLSEASSPVHDWTSPDFNEDASWLSGEAPLGRNEPSFTTTLLNDAQNNYSSVFLRKEFTLSSSPPPSLLLKLLYDDGVIVWLNGTEVLRTPSVEPGLIDFEGRNPSGLDAITSHEKNGYEPFVISGTAGLLQPGTNVIAIQLFNDSIGSSDILIDAVLETPEPFPSLLHPAPVKLMPASPQAHRPTSGKSAIFPLLLPLQIPSPSAPKLPTPTGWPPSLSATRSSTQAATFENQIPPTKKTGSISKWPAPMPISTTPRSSQPRTTETSSAIALLLPIHWERKFSHPSPMTISRTSPTLSTMDCQPGPGPIGPGSMPPPPSTRPCSTICRPTT